MTANREELIHVGALGIRFLVDAEDSAGGAAIFEVGVPVGAQPPAPHSHDAYEETIYGLEGVSTWTVDGRSIEIGAGEAFCIPRGAVHAFTNLGETHCKMLAVVTPGVLGPDFFRELGAVVAGAAGGPPDREKVGEVMRRHGLTPAAPTSA
jgi:quercetin dioxygenase-like cupin family protein